MTIESPQLESVSGTLEMIFRDVVGFEPPPHGVDLIDSGLLDSLTLVMLLAELETAFSITVALEELDLQEFRTISGLIALVRRESAKGARPAAPAQALIVPLRDGTGGAPVFLVPGAGADGAPLALRPLAHALQTSRPVFALAPLAPEDRSEPLWIEDMAEAYVRAIRSSEESEGCVIAGISFGGLVAFETARRLRAAGEPVERLVLFDTRASLRSLTTADYLRFRISQPYRVLRYVLSDLRPRLPDAIRRALRRGPAWVRRKRARSGGPSPGGQPPWPTIVDRAGRAYRPGTYDGATTLFVTRDAPLGTFAPETVWSRRVTGDFSVEPLPGGHLDFLRGSRLGTVAEGFSRLLQAPEVR